MITLDTSVMRSDFCAHWSVWQNEMNQNSYIGKQKYHDDILKWKYFLHYWPFVRGIHQSLVDSPHKFQRCRALIFSLICAWTNGWVNTGDAGDLRCYHAYYNITAMMWLQHPCYDIWLTNNICCSFIVITVWCRHSITTFIHKLRSEVH